MPHCFKLARRISRFRHGMLRETRMACTRSRASRLSALAPVFIALVLFGCSEDQNLPGDPSAAETPTSPPASDSTIVVTDTTGDGIDLALAATNTGTTIYPGQDIQAKVSSYPGGTSFLLKAGIHRNQRITPKAGDTFVGEAGTILSGARRLTTFVHQGGYWVVSGQTQQGQRLGRNCLPSHPRCTYPEQLFINDVLLLHVGSLAAVSPGRWYFDYGADKIYFADDPTGKKVETSVTDRAFDGIASNVTIRALTIEKYANPAGRGVIGYVSAGPGWSVENNTIRWNFGAGIKTGPGMHAVGNNIHHQGQMGISGSGDNVLVQDNEIAYNNTAGFTMGWEAGATKFTRTDGLIVRGNYSHDNHGPGLWTDIDNINTLYENNRVENNDWRGIFHEISYKATIRNNICRGNGFGLPTDRPISPVDGAGILVSNSPNVEVYGNTVSGNKNGIAALETNRGSGKYGVYDVVNLNVHDNSVTQATGRAAGAVQNVGNNAIYTSRNNRFVHNTYDIGSASRQFRWMNGDRTPAEWRSYGLDVTGLFK
jgi:parallel beta-helix repeat protein